MSHLFSKTLLLVGFMVSASYPLSAQSQTSSETETLAEFEDMPAVDNEILDTQRGGFETPDGVKFDIGLHRTISVNGVLQVDNTVNINNVSLYGQTVPVANMQDVSSALRTIVQNNLDNRNIVNRLEADIVVKNFPSYQHAYLGAMQNQQNLMAVQDIQALR